MKNLNTNKLIIKNDSPIFIGSFEDFNKFLSGYARNKVQSITNRYKKKIGNCEHCGKRGVQLDAAHIHGKERKIIIESILKGYKKVEYFQVDLNKFENQFIDAHHPIEDVILILCKPCHIKYDDKSFKNFTNNKSREVKKDNISVSELGKVSSNHSTKVKIGDYVKSVFSYFFENNMLSKEEIENLLSPEYSKKIFGISSNELSVLRHIKYGTKITAESGSEYNRYWVDIFDNKFHVYSQWYNTNKQWSNFKKWELEIKNKNAERISN